MDGIFNFFKGLLVWFFILSFGGGLYLGLQAGSYFSYINIIENQKTQSPAELKYSFRHNIFYKWNKYAEPEEFNDVKYLESK